MKISNSKKELAKIISENGGWCGDYNFAAQDCSGSIQLFELKPTIKRVAVVSGHRKLLCNHKPIKNWHQAILSHAEYLRLYPAPDADGWIEWKGGDDPVDDSTYVDVKLANGREYKKQFVPTWLWSHDNGEFNVLAYRLHKPEQAKTVGVDAIGVAESTPEAKPTIEQLAADYRSKLDYADRKRDEADAAKADAEARLAELVAAGKSIGLAMSVETAESKCADGVVRIANRSQLELGDVIWIGRSGVKEDERRLPEGGYLVVATNPIGVLHNGRTFYPDFSFRSWRFIRRPAK